MDEKRKGPYPRKAGGPRPGKFVKRGSPGRPMMKNKAGKRKIKIPREAMTMAKEHQIPPYMALAVHKGKLTLEQALEQKKMKDERKRKAAEICAEHPSINMALACALVKEGLSPEAHYTRQKQKVERKQQRVVKQKEQMRKDDKQSTAFTQLAHYSQTKSVVVLAKYGPEYQEGTIEEFSPYEFVFSSNNNRSQVHRLELKYMFEKKDEGVVQKAIMIDKALQKKKLRPSHGPDGRFQFPEAVLKIGAEIMMALHEGEMIRGTIQWLTPYDIMLKVGKSNVWVFRHAVTNCMLLRKPT